MSISPGTRIGPFEIVAPLAAGGMGEVYRARDTRLGRDVAVKALPTAFAQDPERLARFEREAKLLASISHPNVAGIHGLEEVAGVRYLVIEYVDGETLAARLARGALPIDEAAEVCRQVAAGVEAAHEGGVMHRDLKPGNIMLTPSGSVKVLDFGLAKGGAAGGSSSNVRLSESPTVAHAATGAGVILGTAAYMSPEQARGKAMDRRTDVWSFGCVLYECLTGRQAYEGETVSDLIAHILAREPDWSALPPTTPPRVVELLRRCLTKDVALRLRDIGEARIALTAPGTVADAAAAEIHAGGRTARRWMAPAIAALLAIVVTTAVLLVLRPAHPAGPVRRYRVPVDGLTTTFFTPLALTRDGRQIAYEAGNRIWIRRMDQLDALEVPGSTGGRAPFWSWDQKTLGFAANKRLWTFAPGADKSEAICDIPESGEILGAAWGPDDHIALAVWRGGLYEVPAVGGSLRTIMTPDSSTVDFHGPSYLPDGRALLLFVHDKGSRSAVAIVEGSPPRIKRVFEDPRAGTASYSPTGHLLITREESHYRIGRTWAVPFSAAERMAPHTRAAPPMASWPRPRMNRHRRGSWSGNGGTAAVRKPSGSRSWGWACPRSPRTVDASPMSPSRMRTPTCGCRTWREGREPGSRPAPRGRETPRGRRTEATSTTARSRASAPIASWPSPATEAEPPTRSPAASSPPRARTARASHATSIGEEMPICGPSGWIAGMPCSRSSKRQTTKRPRRFLPTVIGSPTRPTNPGATRSTSAGIPKAMRARRSRSVAAAGRAGRGAATRSSM